MKIFISYSHRDSKDLADILAHLKPLTRGSGAIHTWSDLQIAAGDDWRGKISGEIDSCDVAILLISASFLASDFIIEDELSPLFKRYGEGKVHILCVPISHSSFASDASLSKIQAVPNPSKPIRALSRAGRDLAYELIRQRVAELGGLGLDQGKASLATSKTIASPSSSSGEPRKTHFTGETVFLPQLFNDQISYLNQDGYLAGIHFEKCVIKGPAVVVTWNCIIRKAKFTEVRDLDMEGFLFTDTGKRKVQSMTGTVFLEDCMMMDCEFQNIAFCSSKSGLDRIRGMLSDSNLVPFLDEKSSEEK